MRLKTKQLAPKIKIKNSDPNTNNANIFKRSKGLKWSQ